MVKARAQGAEQETARIAVGPDHPGKSLSAEMRPPACRRVGRVHPPSEERLMAEYYIFKEYIPQVELMMDLPETDLPSSEEPVQAVLNTLSVHPLSKKEVDKYLHGQNLDWNIISDLIQKDLSISIPIRGTEFFIRKYPEKNSS